MVKQRIREKLLMTMYRSVERMNLHAMEGNSDGVRSEEALQINLRKNFEEVSEKESVQAK